MCMGSTPVAPVAPPTQAEAAQLPNPTQFNAVAANRKRKSNSNIMTSSQGVTTNGNTATKTLLGQ